MIVLKIQGGLGNQMFEYASGFGIAKKTGQNITLDLSGLNPLPKTPKRNYSLNIFDISPKFLSRKQLIRFTLEKRLSKISSLLRKIGVNIPFYIAEKNVNFNENLFTIKNDTYLDGWWQSEKYFKHVETDIRKMFVFKKLSSEETWKVIKNAEKKDSVAIQVRRRDYVTNPKTAALHGALGPEYYQKAISYIQSRVNNPVFFVISDDSEWVRENIKTYSEMIFPTVSDHDQMRIMKSCKHHIIANSSFGWWGAYLGSNPNKIVVAPQKWFAGLDCNIDDRLPQEWIKI